jgi:asparagine synthase (glutamine-hydrolysing)
MSHESTAPCVWSWRRVARTCSDGCDVLTWDGRLHNRRELSAATSPGSDAEIAGRAYSAGGLAGLRALIGDWTIAIEDRRSQQLVLARDFAGTRPLYYHVDDTRVRWSTSLTALVDTLERSDLDQKYVAGFLVYGGCPGRTPYQGIRSVRPGHVVQVSAAALSTTAYWSAPTTTLSYRDERDYDEHLRLLFREAVAVRLGERGPVSAELSGGCDSSSVVSMASELIRSGAVAATSLRTISYVQEGSSDPAYVSAVDAFCGTSSDRLSLERYPVFSHLRPAGAKPGDGSPLQEAAAEVARRAGTVAFLTGQGGDALLGNWLDDSAQVVRWIRTGRLGKAVREAYQWSLAGGKPLAAIAGRLLALQLPPALAKRFFPILAPQPARRWLADACTRQLTSADVVDCCSIDWASAPIERRLHFREIAIARELGALEPPGGLRSAGYTHPFYHRPLVEFLMCVPAEVLCRPGEPRRLMRRAFAHLWPVSLQDRRSKGLFGLAYLNALRPFAAALLRDHRWLVAEYGWVDPGMLRDRLCRLVHGVGSGDVHLRRALFLEHWLRDRCGDHRVSSAA